MTISAIRGSQQPVAVLARAKVESPTPSPSMQTIAMPQVDSGAIVESGLERMQAMRVKFKDDSPLPRPNPASPVDLRGRRGGYAIRG